MHDRNTSDDMFDDRRYFNIEWLVFALGRPANNDTEPGGKLVYYVHMQKIPLYIQLHSS